MVKLFVPNHNRQGKVKHITFDTLSNELTSDTNKQLDKIAFLSNAEDFYHPIFDVSPFDQKHTRFAVEYDNYNALFGGLKKIYATLLHAQFPNKLLFKFYPTAKFLQPSKPYLFWISIDSHTKATEQISIDKLNSIIEAITKEKFSYCDKYLIKEEITAQSLPEFVNADQLFEYNEKLDVVLRQPEDLSGYELRYISHKIGFGVFSRAPIKKGDLICTYTGLKQHPTQKVPTYTFSNIDQYNFNLDAKHFGNLTRFINHAPEKSGLPNRHSANVTSLYHAINGLGVIVFYAKRDISASEQLLLEYCKKPFESKEFSFSFDNQLYDEKNRKIKTKQYGDKFVMSILANHGVKGATKYILFKPILSFIVALVVITIINKFM